MQVERFFNAKLVTQNTVTFSRGKANAEGIVFVLINWKSMPQRVRLPGNVKVPDRTTPVSYTPAEHRVPS